MQGLPPGPEESSLRQFMRMVRDPIGFAEDCRRRYGPVFTVRALGMPVSVHVALPEVVREVFANPGDTLFAGEANAPIELLVGRHSLVRLDGARHRRERKLMMPSVHGDRMALYGRQIHAITRDVLHAWRPGEMRDVQDVMQDITLRVILETVFGMSPGPRYERLQALVKEFLTGAMHPWVATLGLLVPGDGIRRFLGGRVAPLARALPVGGGLLRRLPGVELAHCIQQLDALLYEELATRRKEAAGRKDVMSMLIQAVDEEGGSLSDEELRDEMMTLLVAGHETTATTLTWATALVLEHPEVLEALRAEHGRVFGEGGYDPERVRNLKYAEAVAKETLRRYPVAIGVARLLKQPMTLGGYTLPAGVVVSPSVYLLQHDPTLWPEPHRFDPMRFVDQTPKAHSWLPFGGGVRICLGMAFSLYEMKAVLSTLFHHAELRRAPGPLPRLGQRGILMGPSEPIRVALEGWRTTLPLAA